MRPTLLNPLFTNIRNLSGVGDKAHKNYLRMFGSDLIKDLIYHLPVGFVDRTNMPDLTYAENKTILSAVVDVKEHFPPKPRSRQPYKVVCQNETGYITLVFFNHKGDYIKNILPVGQKRVISGKVEKYDGILSMTHPDRVVPLSEIKNILIMEPVYPLTYGISQRSIIKTVQLAVNKIPELPEWIEENYCAKNHWNSWADSIRRVHKITSGKDLEPTLPTRQRLAYDELLASQLALAISRQRNKKQKGYSLKNAGTLRQRMLDGLPFTLTKGQNQVLKDIYHDMEEPSRMLRLLQGDVGAGKTVVALQAMLCAIESGKQCALMAPTEILARQHGASLQNMLEQAGLNDRVTLTVLTGKEKGKTREAILHGLEQGSTHIVVGTHALFQEHVTFANLGFVAIDEQHRFGVKQRLQLTNKGDSTDILLMTATPIPRTLTLTLYGDIDVSLLKEKPAGRQAIDTRILPKSRIDDVTSGLKRAISEGNRIYWVCPLIEEDEEQQNQFAAVETRFKELNCLFPNRVGLVHGKLKSDEKEQVMAQFKEGALDILVATTVIEVGVDVPEATIMIIEEAQQFGLSQLHQLRGRVGRGTKKSNCILIYGHALSETGKRRLQIMRETEDGFRIAEEDLLLRGSGEILGTKQSGMPDFFLASFPEHNELLLAARDDVKYILQNDPKLTSPRGQNLRTLLYLFSYDEHIGLLMSG